MNLKNTICSLLLGFILSPSIFAQSPIVVNQSTSANDNEAESPYATTVYCSNHGNTMSYYVHIFENLNLIGRIDDIDVSLIGISNSIVSQELIYDGPIINGAPYELISEQSSSTSKRSKSIGPTVKLERGRYIMMIELDENVTRAQISRRNGHFGIKTTISYSKANENHTGSFSIEFCEKYGRPFSISLSDFKVSTLAHSNETLVEFNVTKAATLVNIDAVSLMHPGQRVSIISNQVFSMGLHRLLVDNSELHFGVSQIILQRNQEISSQKTIRL